MKRNKGITLIALVITIVIIVILASVSIEILTGDNGIIKKAREATILQELSAMKEEFELYLLDKQAENIEFDQETLTAGPNSVYYNTMPEDNEENIYTIMPSLSGSKTDNRTEIIKGQILITSTNETEIKVAQKLGIEVNPYDIVDGEFLSSDNNLLILDSKGTVIVPATVTKIGAGAFRNLTGIKNVIIPSNVKEIEDYAFSGNSTLETVQFSEGLEIIGSFAFQDCINLKEIEFPSTVKSLGNSCFAGCNSLKTVIVPGNIEEIPYRLFYCCSGLETIIYEEGVKKLGGDSANGCTSLISVKISKSVETIGDGAFENDLKLNDINIDSDNKKYIYSNGLLMNAGKTELLFVSGEIKNLSMPNTIKVIRSKSLSGNTSLTTINIPASVETIDSAFSLRVQRINVDSSNLYYKSDNGNLYDHDVKTLIKYCSNDTEAILPNTVETIKGHAFSGQSKISSIILPDSLIRLENSVFNGLKITEISLGKNVTKFNSMTFLGVVDMLTVNVSEENENIKSVDGTYILSKDGKKLFAVSKQLEEYNIPDTVEIIEKYSMYSRKKLKSIILPEGLKEISEYGFDNSTSLEKVEIPSSIETIGNTAFQRCNSLKEIIVHKKQGEISGSPWGAPYGARAIKWEQ